MNTTSIKSRRLSHAAQIILLITLPSAVSSCQQQPSANREPPANREAQPARSPTPITGPAGFPPPVMNKPYPGTGVVAAINKPEGWIEINHEDIKDLMPAMQMEFNVKDKSLLDKVTVGDRVDFTIVETAKGEYLTEIRRNTAASP